MMRQFQTPETETLVQSVLEEVLRDRPPSHDGLPREIREVLAQIHRHPFDLQLNVRHLKSCCRIRDNNVSSRFSYVMGMTIKQYVEALRMEAASRLLREVGMGIFDIAVSVGYH